MIVPLNIQFLFLDVNLIVFGIQLEGDVDYCCGLSEIVLLSMEKAGPIHVSKLDSCYYWKKANSL